MANKMSLLFSKDEMLVHEKVKDFYKGFNLNGHPMSIMCGVVGALSSGNRDRERDRERERDYEPYNEIGYYPPDYRYERRYCVREQITEWYRCKRYVSWETRFN